MLNNFFQPKVERIDRSMRCHNVIRGGDEDPEDFGKSVSESSVIRS